MQKANNIKSILLVGVGGQGILRASDIISLVMVEADFDVKKSEVHGMAQRGGCVTSYVRFGRKVYSPLALKGEVDILVSFEKLETLRYLDFMKPDGIIIINDNELYPPAVNLGDAEYPTNVVETVRAIFKSVKVIDAAKLAKEAGNARAENTVLLGALSHYLDIERPIWEAIIKRSFPEKSIAVNLRAFNMGRKE